MMLRQQHLLLHLLTTGFVVFTLTLVNQVEPSLAKVTDGGQLKPSEAAAFEFAYETKDEEGNLQMHREQQDSHGRRVGTYGYRHANGIYRFVDYVADSLGYRATIRTNEPGTQSSAGADVTVEAAPTPAGVVEESLKNINHYASKASVVDHPVQQRGSGFVAQNHFSKHSPVPLPLVVVSSPMSRQVRPVSFGVVPRSDPEEVPRTPEEPAEEAVHAADVVQPIVPRTSVPRIDSALLFPAPPLIRPPRYRPRGGKALQPGFIEAAFRKRRS